MNNFEHLQSIQRKLDIIEESLRTLRDYSAPKTKGAINAAIGEVQKLRNNLWQVDDALTKENKSG